MKTVAITGGIASGKTTVKDFIIKAGHKFIDADEISHEVLTEEEIIKKLVEYFGPTILEEKKINRKRLGQIVFEDEASRLYINKIIHPKVKERITEELKTLSEEKIVFIDVPLLYEAKMQKDFQYVVVVYINYKLQVERLMKRDNISEDFAKIKINSQMPLSKKIKQADFLINNEGSLQQTEEQVNELLRRIENEI